MPGTSAAKCPKAFAWFNEAIGRSTTGKSGLAFSAGESRNHPWRLTYSRIAVLAREYRLSCLRLQNTCNVPNSLWPKTVTTRCKETILRLER